VNFIALFDRKYRLLINPSNNLNNNKITTQFHIIQNLITQHGIQVEVNGKELRRIPQQGPFILITNRKYQEIDEWVLLQVLGEKLENFRFISGMSQIIKPSIHSFYHHSTSQKNATLPSYLKTKSNKLEAATNEGYSTGVFIDRMVSRFFEIPQNQSLKKLFKTIKDLSLPLVPIHLDYDGIPDLSGNASALPNGRPLKVVVRIGQAVGSKEQKSFQKISRFRKYVQAKIYALGSALEIRPFYFNEHHEEEVEVIAPQPLDLIERDVNELKYHNLISSQGEFDVFIAPAVQIPAVIQEIGRLREITFRKVGEGTGNNCDLDEYDLYYEQLFIWDRVNKRIVGGYRLGRGEEIFKKYGVEGFYIHSLFKIKEGFHPIMQQAVELGRSFIIEEYQRKRLPLFLLWRGILFFLLRNPQYRYLYGPLSISKYYSAVSKSIIVEFVMRNYFDHNLAQYLIPRTPFNTDTTKIDMEVLLEQFNGSISSLDNFIEDIEPNHFKIPVLMKQYIKQNARFISFNLDPNFSDVLDGFMILDLQNVPYTTLEALKKES